MQNKAFNILVILTIIFNVLMGCNAPKNVENKNVTNIDRIEIDSVKIEPEATNPLIISFFSRGAGIDYTAYKNLLMAINEHNTTYNTKLVFSSTNWGREGEKDLCFPNQSTSNFDDFVTKTKSALDSNKNVHLYFNEVCREGK